MKTLKWISLLLTFVMICVSCGCRGGSDGASSPVAPSVDVTGVWKGPVDSTVSGSRIAILSVKQTGASITGTYNSTVVQATVSGTVSGNLVKFTMKVASSGCDDDRLVGNATVNTSQSEPATMSIQYEGSSTCGDKENGTGRLTRL